MNIVKFKTSYGWISWDNDKMNRDILRERDK